MDLQTPGDRTRLFVVERRGRIRILRGGSVVAAPFLDIGDRVGSGGSEQGLLGLAFHPRFSENGRFFVNYTDRSGDTHIAEFRAAAGADTADPGSERTILLQDQPFANHNGGQLRFGPDGYLYIGLGDGGSGGSLPGRPEPGQPAREAPAHRRERGAALRRARGQPVRLAVGGAARGWAYGLRNPWRFAFDAVTGDLVIGDVGQNAVEEVSVEPAPRRGLTTAGTSPRARGASARRRAARATASPPGGGVHHGEGCSITGGVVYRGCRMPGYAGTYFYGDYCAGFVRPSACKAARPRTSATGRRSSGRGRNLSSFGVDAEGEVLHPGAGRRRLPHRPRELKWAGSGAWDT